jgi:hypothetical protein
MALVVAFDDAKINQVRKQGKVSDGLIGGTTTTPFFGSRNRPDLPHATLNQHHAGRISTTHFHSVDQFQVVVDGKGKLGRHDLAPYCVHFSRAYTPYGPLVEDADIGTTMFVLRAHPDPGPHHLPKGLGVLKQVPDRQPWQVTRPAVFPAANSEIESAMLQEISGIKDDAGLAAYTLRMKPNASVNAPDPSHGDGQYLVVLKGSLLHDAREHAALALVFVRPDEGPYGIQAGPKGLEALVLNFPRPRTTAVVAARSAGAA